MMGLFDTHAHLYDKAFDRDREEVIHHIFETLDYVVIPSEDLVTSEKAVALAESHPSLYAAVGIHPQVTKDATEEALAAIGALARTHDKVKAVGERGSIATESAEAHQWQAAQGDIRGVSADLPQSSKD